ncbi:hypothetical protein K523DRAFT_345192 [Schizophyllum commune Tattone D]|nr:hypothetical protein K523DRAFT_345192 [Schizophyllum commune Tattone D]
MPFNNPDLFLQFHTLMNLYIVLPSPVHDMRHLDLHALRRAGYRGAVLDKERPMADPPQGPSRPGARSAGAIQVEAVGYALGALVLCHTALKPSYSCVKGIRADFAGLPELVRDDELGSLAVWSTGVWQRDATVRRLMERGLVDVVGRWSAPSNDQATRSFIRQSVYDSFSASD